VKALSLTQPWATLIADGRKTIETRSWPTIFRGRIAIHAAKSIDSTACQDFGYKSESLPRGAILGTAELYSCVRFPHPSAPPDEYGDFSDGRYGFLLRDFQPLDAPIPEKGSLGLWYWTP
jgi:hypothetical protein